MPSTSISRTEYDPLTRILSVWFVASGKRYDYQEVPPETYAAFRNAFAKGRFFNDHIRNHYSYRLHEIHSATPEPHDLLRTASDHFVKKSR